MKTIRLSVPYLLISIFFASALAYAQEVDVDALSGEASSQYQAQSWAESVSSHSRLVELQTNNHLAWYRLGVSHNALGQGAAARDALNKARAGTQIPSNLIDYQLAIAHKHMQELESMWQKLEAAAESGFSNEQLLLDDDQWAAHAAEPRFKQVLQRVARNAHPCVYDERFLQFDFWLGDWEVYGNIERTGPLYGRNSISKKEDGCLVLEQWQGASGTTGTSMNYYDGTLDKWVQHWVSVGGVTINIAGGLVDGSMDMQGEIFYLTGNDPQIRDFRAKWTPLKDGIVRQFFEESIDQGKTWYPWFEGFYFPQTSEVDE